MSGARRTIVVAAAVGSTLLATSIGAVAQVDTPPVSTTTSTTRSTTTTTTPPSASTTSTTLPAGDGDGTTTGQRVVPPEIQSLINSVKRTRANSTAKVLQALRPLESLGLTPAEAAVAGLGRFPVAGPANFVDDWWFPRFNPSFHLHQGTDIFAAQGTPVRSPTEGTLKQANGPVGGLAVYVTQDDGTYFYMAHLAGFVEGQANGQRVKVGEVVGYVGDTGNARGGSPHLHFEIHPAPTKLVTSGKGKARKTEVVVVKVAPGTQLAAINPKPYLDQWIGEALGNAPRVLAFYQAARPRVVVSTGVTRRLARGPATVLSGLSAPPRRQLLWAAAASPAGGGLAIASAEAARAAASIDWARRERLDRARRAEWDQAERAVSAILARSTPPGLRPLLALSL